MDPPIKPDESDCCNSGCNPCILDIYEEQLKKYEARLNQTVFRKQSEAYKNCISPTSYSVFKLLNREKHKNDTYLYTFEYCKPFKKTKYVNSNLQLYYKPGQHFLLKASDSNTGTDFTRAYTPIPHKNSGSLSFVILIRIYEAGKMSTYLSNLRCGQETLWRGPYCNFSVNYSLKNILFIAQGTGIAPIFAVLINILSNENCESRLHLFYCCKNIGDILLRDEIYKLKENWNFLYEVFLNNVQKESIKYNESVHNRRLQKCDIMRYLENKLGDNLQVLICGSTQFETCIKGYVLDFNVKDEHIYVF